MPSRFTVSCVTASERLLGIRELGELLGVAPQTIRGNRDHPLYSMALKLGGPTSPLKWRRRDVAEFLGVEVAELRGAAASESSDRAVDLDRREAELARREREIDLVLAEIKSLLRRLDNT